MVRKLSARLLASLGYRTVEAEDGPTALQVLDRRDDVALLLSDVMLPGGMDGPALAREAVARRPGLKVVHMSGYPASAIADGGVLDPETPILTKPFGKAELAQMLRRSLAPCDGG
jgi:CheY-like chemotaxis protein